MSDCKGVQSKIRAANLPDSARVHTHTIAPHICLACTHGGATTMRPDATHPPAICQNLLRVGGLVGGGGVGGRVGGGYWRLGWGGGQGGVGGWSLAGHALSEARFGSRTSRTRREGRVAPSTKHAKKDVGAIGALAPAPLSLKTRGRGGGAGGGVAYKDQRNSSFNNRRKQEVQECGALQCNWGYPLGGALSVVRAQCNYLGIWPY